MRRKINLKFIVCVMIFVVYAFMFCNKSQAADDWNEVKTYKINDAGNLADGENLATANDKWGDLDYADDKIDVPGAKKNPKTAHSPLTNFAYQVWNREIYGGNSWKDISGSTDSDFKNVYSDSAATKAPTKKYVVFMRDELASDGINL